MDEGQGQKKYAYYQEWYVLEGVVEETKRTPAIHFKYRPLSIKDSAVFDSKISKQESVSLLMNSVLDLLIDRITEWDVVKPGADNGEEEIVNHKDKDELRKMDPHVLMKIAEIIKEPKALDEDEAKNSL